MKSISFLLLPAALLFLNSCVQVQPYERGNLSKPIVTGEQDGLRKSMTEHAYFSREASFGGGGVGGGGCGCN